MTRCNNRKTANYWIKKLGLVQHPEGGYYKETYRSDFMTDTHIDSVKAT